MTRSLKRSSTFFFTALIGSFSLLFFSSSVQAQTAAQPNVTDRVWVAKRGAAPEYHTEDWYAHLHDSIRESAYGSLSLPRAQFVSDFQKAMDSGTWMVVQEEVTSPRYGDYAFYRVLFTFAKHDVCKFKVFNTSGHFSIRSMADPSISDCSFRYAHFHVDSNVGVYSPSFLSSASGVLFSQSGSTDKTSILFFSGAYDLDVSASGMTSLPHKDPGHPGVVPDITWNNDCGLDIGCHLSNVSLAIKALFQVVVGIFDFSENNTLLKLFKWLFVPSDLAAALDFSDVSASFQESLSPVFNSLKLLNTAYKALVPAPDLWNSSNYCSTSAVGDAGSQNSAASRYVMDAEIFGKRFRPDICSFERAIGGYSAMAQVRVYTSVALIVTSLFLWYRFVLKVTGVRV